MTENTFFINYQEILGLNKDVRFSLMVFLQLIRQSKKSLLIKKVVRVGCRVVEGCLIKFIFV